MVPELYTIHQIPLFWGRGCWILFQSFLLFAQYSWWQYSLKATLSNFYLSPGLGQMLIHSQDITLSPHPFLPWGRITAFRHISGGTYSNPLTQDLISSYLPTRLTNAPTVLSTSDGLELCLLLSWKNHPGDYHPRILSDVQLNDYLNSGCWW